MKSIGYWRGLNANFDEEFIHIDKPPYSIEFLYGKIGSGKTFAMNEFFKNNKKVIYLKSYTDKDELAIADKDELLKKLSGAIGENILVAEGGNDIPFNDIKDAVLDFAREKGYTILLDIRGLYNYTFLKDLDDVNVVISILNKNSIEKNRYKLPVYITDIDYRTIELQNKNYSGNISLRIPKSLHGSLSEEAKNEGISLNQYLLYILSSR